MSGFRSRQRTARPRWRMRNRLTLVIAVSSAAPMIAGAVWVVVWFSEGPPSATGVAILALWTTVIIGFAVWYGTTAASYLVGPLDSLTSSLRQFDPSLGDAGHPALEESVGEPLETAALKRALRQAVGRIGRDRSQKEAVVGGLMHDLKTPLVAQSLLIERLDSCNEADRQVMMYELKRSSLGAVVRLNRLIDVLRVDSVPVHSPRSAHDVRAIVDDVIANLGPLVSSRGVDLEATGSWTSVIDRDAVERAIENVVANGVRHATSRVRVEVFAGVVRVTDDGPGFARAFEELVDPFQAGPMTTDGLPGTAGLGLYIARRSLEAGGGRLKLETTSPGRTVVLLYLGVA